MADWKMEQTESVNAATYQRRGQTVELVYNCGEIDVDIRQGSGYLEQNCSSSIPLDVVIKMLVHRGYTVSKPPGL